MTESTFDPLFEATVAERRRLVGLLSELTEEQWAHHSLCKGWRVREVVAHITAAYRLTPETVMAGVAAAAGDWNAACDVLAKRDTAQYSDAELLASLAENVTHPWQPPGGGQAGALSHDVIQASTSPSRSGCHELRSSGWNSCSPTSTRAASPSSVWTSPADASWRETANGRWATAPTSSKHPWPTSS